MKKLLLIAGSIFTVIAVAACSPAPNATDAATGEIQSTTDAETDTSEAMEEGTPEASSDTEDAASAN